MMYASSSLVSFFLLSNPSTFSSNITRLAGGVLDIKNWWYNTTLRQVNAETSTCAGWGARRICERFLSPWNFVPLLFQTSTLPLMYPGQATWPFWKNTMLKAVHLRHWIEAWTWQGNPPIHPSASWSFAPSSFVTSATKRALCKSPSDILCRRIFWQASLRSAWQATKQLCCQQRRNQHTMMTWRQAIVVGYTHLRRQTNKLNSFLEKTDKTYQFSSLIAACTSSTKYILSWSVICVASECETFNGSAQPRPISLVWRSVVHPPYKIICWGRMRFEENTGGNSHKRSLDVECPASEMQLWVGRGSSACTSVQFLAAKLHVHLKHCFQKMET